MIKTSWIERKSDEIVLEEIGERMSLMIETMERKIKFIIVHIMHRNDIFEGRIMGPIINYFHDVKENMGCLSNQQLKKTAKNRHTWLFS